MGLSILLFLLKVIRLTRLLTIRFAHIWAFKSITVMWIKVAGWARFRMGKAAHKGEKMRVMVAWIR